VLFRSTAELENAPPEVSQVLSVIPSDHVEAIPLTEEISDLAEAYVAAGVLGRASLGDAIHVAAASVAGADLILSWNFRHIVNFNRIRGFNSVNLRIGYHTMTILSPREALDE